MQSIGFIGAGMMGHGICLNLLKAGHPLQVVAHRNRARIEDLVGRGATEARDAQALVRASEVVMICVNSADTVDAIVRGPGAALREGAAVIDVTTSLPETSRRLQQELAGRGIDFVDAPVVGGPPQAAQGKLGTFAGATTEAFARVRPVLDTYSAQVVRFGGPGAGNEAKLVNNFVTVGMRALLVHGFRAARRRGIDWRALYELMAQGAAGSRTLDTMIGASLDGSYRGNQFSIGNCVKDMGYAGALLAGDEDGRRLQEAMVQFFRRFADAGFAERLASEMLDPAVESAVLGSGR